MTLIITGDGGAVVAYSLMLLRGNPRLRSPGSDDDNAFGVDLPLKGIVIGAAAEL
jgi:hypothetical protein